MDMESNNTKSIGILKAAGRQGLREFREALKALPDAAPTMEELGAIGNVTPQQVSIESGINKQMSDREPEMG